MVTTNTRAGDSDRNNTCQVLDSALSEGQLSMEEHRQRVSAATNATTLGELQSLVSDLQIHSAPTQLPTLKSPPRRWVIRIAVAAVLVLVGVGIAWGLNGNNPSPSKISSAPSANGNGPALVIPSTAPPQAPQQLLTLGGLTGFLAQIQKQFGDTLGYELVVYPDDALLTRPDSVNPHETVQWSYVNGDWTNTGARPMPPATTVGDLSKFDVQAALGALRDAPQTLHISNPTTTTLLIDAAKDGSLALQIVLSDGTNNGFIQLAADGTVNRILPPAR